MANLTMKKFLVLYLVPQQVMGDWAKLTRKHGNPLKRKCATTGNAGWASTGRWSRSLKPPVRPKP